jgi:hypothetical protein
MIDGCDEIKRGRGVFALAQSGAWSLSAIKNLFIAEGRSLSTTKSRRIAEGRSLRFVFYFSDKSAQASLANLSEK